MATSSHVKPDLDGNPVGKTKDLVTKLFEFLKSMSLHVWEFNNNHATEQASNLTSPKEATLLDEKQYNDCIYENIRSSVTLLPPARRQENGGYTHVLLDQFVTSLSVV